MSRPDTQQGSAAGGAAEETAIPEQTVASRGETVPPLNQSDPFAGRVLSHYRLEARLGEGGMGLLYRATDLALGRSVAIKLLARHLVGDEIAKVRFLREARAASALDHSYRHCLRCGRAGRRDLHRHGSV